MHDADRNPDTRILCIHGAGGGGWEWDIWRRVFDCQGWTARTPDLLPAAAGLAQTQLDDYRAQMQRLLAGCERPVLIGASLGGLIAAQLATEVAARALVLVNPLPPHGIQPRPPARRERRPIVPWASRRSLAGTLRAMPDADAAAVLFAHRHWRDESGAVLDQALAGVVLPVPACRTLVVASEADTDVALATSQSLAQVWGAALWVLPRASHVGPLLGRDAAQIAWRVAEWLSAGDSVD